MTKLMRMLALLAGLVTSSVYAVTCPTFVAGDRFYIAKLNQLSAGCAPIGGGAPGSPLTTKGDLWTYTTGDARLAVGTNGYVLSANSGASTGLEWIAVPASSLTATYIGYGNGSNALTGSSALTYAASGGVGITNTQTYTGSMLQKFTNSSNGTSATSEIWMLNDTSGVASFGKRSSGFTTTGLKTADQSFLSVNGGTFLFSNADSSDFIFARGGTAAGNEVMRLGAGTLSLGVAGTTVGAVQLNNATSGSITVQPPTGALGTITATIAATTGTHYPNPMTTAGDIVIGGASGVPTRLAAGSTSGHVLTSNGSGVAPSWQAASGSGTVLPGTCNCRLTLSSGNATYDPQNLVTVSNQDTSNDTITVTSHGWTVGTMVYSTQTSGGLTALTTYYVGNVTANTVTLHTTVAAAVAGTSKVDITGTVTANIQAFGVSNATVYLTPYRGKYIALYDGSSTWNLRAFSEISLALSGLTSGLPYDIFVYDNSGTPALRAAVAWSNGFTRATALTLQDGVYVKSGATTDLYVGTIYTTSTASTESSVGGALSQIGGKRFVWNNFNRISAGMAAIDTTSTWSYTTDTWRQANGATGNKVEYVAGLNEGILTANLAAVVQAVNHSTRSMKISIGINSTTSPAASIPQQFNPSATSMNFTLTAAGVWTAGIGYTYAAWIERGADTGSTYIGEAGNSRSALIASGLF